MSPNMFIGYTQMSVDKYIPMSVYRYTDMSSDSLSNL